MTAQYLKAASVLLATAVATPLLAQTPPPPGPIVKVYKHHNKFANLSPEGQAIVREAMRETPGSHDEIKAVRQRMLTLLESDRLDVDAVRRAQAEERDISLRYHQRRQEAMLAAYQRLSAADRKALAATMREMDARMEARMKHMHKRAKEMKDHTGGR